MMAWHWVWFVWLFLFLPLELGAAIQTWKANADGTLSDTLRYWLGVVPKRKWRWASAAGFGLGLLILWTHIVLQYP